MRSFVPLAQRCAAREQALAVCAALGDTPAVRRRVARACGCSERTLRRAAARQRAGEPVLRPRGRRRVPVAREVRTRLLETMLALPRNGSVAALRARFTELPYRFLAWMKRRLARAQRRRRGWHLRRLEWIGAGRMWATDFTEPDAELERGATHLLHVRDLASGAQLACVPCHGETARVACCVLVTLFVLLGAPLVVKHDGGGAFCAHVTQDLLAAFGVVSLRSPPYTPRYNGSCERSGGWIKEDIAHFARLAGHPDRWDDASIAAALWQANEIARPHGATRPSPGEDFRARTPITPAERARFARIRRRHRAGLQRTHSTKRGILPTCADRAAMDRRATQQTLCETGILTIGKGRLSTVVSRRRSDGIA